MANMDLLPRLFVLLVAMVAIPRLAAEECPLGEPRSYCSSHETISQSVCRLANCLLCFCEVDSSALNVWQYICLNSCEELTTLFRVEYAADRSFKFVCGEYEPHYGYIFHHVNLTGIKAFTFKNCSLPESSYGDIIPYQEQYPVDYMKIDSVKDIRQFSAEMFGNLSVSLKNLILSHNKLETLPENLFSNCTNLKYLNLADNKLKEIPESVFTNTTNLVNLDLSYNLLESLPEEVFQKLSKLEKLFLNNNKLNQLHAATFNNLISLKNLDLFDNHLVSLPEKIFSGLQNLFTIRLSTNKLRTLSGGLFSDTKNLKNLDLSSNLFIESLPESLLSNVKQLENINIANCNLLHIHDHFFANCPNLTIVLLQRNYLTFLPDAMFKNNSKVQEINLDSNVLNELPVSLFPNQMKLQKFSICRNNLSNVPDGLFQRARNLKSLDMGRNRIQNASKSLFQDLPNLEELDLNRNNLTFFELDENEFLRRIDLSYNNLSKFPDIQWTRHLKVVSVNLNYNKISFITIPIMYSSKPELKLEHNKITTVNTQLISRYDNSVLDFSIKHDSQLSVKLYSNPFTCDCRLFEFYNYIQRSSIERSTRFDVAQNLTCQEPSYLLGEKIMSLSPSQFICEVNGSCPRPCQCYYRYFDNANVLNCSYLGLTKLPTDIPSNINVLFFEGNSLTQLKDLNGDKWENLTELYLDSNQISNLHHWNMPVNLKNLSLNDNNVSFVPHSFMKSISYYKEMKLSMSGNPLNCNCSTVDLKKWLAEQNHVITDAIKIKCANDIKVNGTLVRSVILTTPDNMLCAVNDWPYKLHLIFVTVTCVILAILLVLVSALYYRNKQTVIAYVYIHMHQVFTCFFSEEDFDEDKVFDAFLSYSGSDRNIALSIREELEDKDPHFRLCLHDRNWIAGNPISWNIFNSVQNSKRTVLLLSKEFLTSMWFQVEFHTAYYQMLEDKIDRLIIIVKGELPPKETLDKDLQYLLTTKTYLVWEEKWFWEKLKYALPHKRHQLVPNDVLALKDRPDSEKVKPIETQIAILSNEGTKSNGKLHEVIQNHTNSTMQLISKENK